MAVEMTASRLLSPFFGNSLFVWTNIIGLIMLALSLGYYLGGIAADKRPQSIPYFSLILFTSVWILLIPLFSNTVINSIIRLFPTLSGMMIFGSFLSVLFLIVVPMILLGMIVPYTVKLVTKDLVELGRASGHVSAFSTFGSICGTFLPAFVFIPIFGTSNTFLIVGLILFLVAILGLKKIWLLPFVLLVLPMFFLPAHRVFADDDIIYSTDSPYQLIFVKQDERGRREFYLDNRFGIQSVYDPDKVLLNEYYSYFGILPTMMDNPRKVLILGHAGGSFTRIFNKYFPDLDITGVELDPKVTDTARKYFFLNDLDVTIIDGDARGFLMTTDEKYDLIIMDAYHVLSIPTHLATREFFATVKAHLYDNGIFAANVLSHESDFLSSVANTVSSEFSKVELLPIPTSLNTMLIASESGKFEANDLPADLYVFNDFFEANKYSWDFDPDVDVFTDDKSALVDLKTQAMMLDLFSF